MNESMDCCQEEAGRTRSVLQSLFSEVEDFLKVAGADLGDRAKQAKEKLAVQLSSAKAAVSDAEAHAKEHIVDGAKATDAFIRKHPYQTAGAALVLGVAVGLLINRNR